MVYTLLFSLQNAVCFIILTYLVPALFTFYIQCVLKLKKNNSGAKRDCTKIDVRFLYAQSLVSFINVGKKFIEGTLKNDTLLEKLLRSKDFIGQAIETWV